MQLNNSNPSIYINPFHSNTKTSNLISTKSKYSPRTYPLNSIHLSFEILKNEDFVAANSKKPNAIVKPILRPEPLPGPNSAIKFDDQEIENFAKELNLKLQRLHSDQTSKKSPNSSKNVCHILVVVVV